ncbi:MAG: phosphate ABC transporter substrate-binding protein [Desulfobulbaceae bacterium BRH_c16a]|nr:MAG: phosphate ABC transporter substrate-binding protein [Desulfobulbaceae bacterium BRH_c16a]KJS01532.1 MAG: phosphate ABC transporter substrate-binding protein [Desulfobulbaceae bacterium BRH_c16a]
MKVKSLLAASGLTLIMSSPALAARDYISIVGSSTVYPFSTVVAEQFGKTSGSKTPKIESTGTGGGFKLFCSGVGVDFADITNASRAIKSSELKTCVDNGVKEIIEVKIGYDGIVVANVKTAEQLELSRADLFLALAKEVPDPKNPQTLIANPYKNWQEINSSLPAIAIEVLGPPPTSGTRDAFVELVMEEGCNNFDVIKNLKKSDKKAHKTVCQTVREDGAFVEAGENDNLIVQKLQSNPKAFGIFGFSFLDQNIDKLQGAVIEGHAPTFEAIADGSYTVSRPLFFYVKKAHVEVIPGMKGFLAEFTSEKAWGTEGYLADKGLIPMPEAERNQVAAGVAALKAMEVQ